MDIPNFEDPKWIEERRRLEQELGQRVLDLVDHMRASAMLAQFEVSLADGRVAAVTLEITTLSNATAVEPSGAMH